MKDRILAYLDDFARGRPGELANELMAELKLDASTFQQYAQEAQAAILHQYSQFSISTIDAFFQRVIRSFTREAGLVGDYRLEVEQDLVMEEVMDNLIDELGTNPELTHWVVEFAKENLENERAWDVRHSLIEFAREIFREEFKLIEDDVVATTADRRYFHDLRDQLWQVKQQFLNRLAPRAAEALSIIQSHGWDISDLSYGKNSGLISFFENYATEKNIKDIKEPGARIQGTFTLAENWPSKKSPRAAEIVRVARTQLVPLLQELLDVYDKHHAEALSAEIALRNLYVFGLVADISRKLKEYKDDNNMMLLADAPKFLNGVIQDSDTPFIYEKVGSFYRNYLIDEFQDTSGLQWRNFLPLLMNSLDSGYPSLVVGDVKQAIYRWRGGDLKLLQEQVEHNIGPSRVEVKTLNSNFRSAAAIVDFNNALFQAASTIVAGETGHVISSEAYRDVAQQVSRGEEGFVEMLFLPEDREGERWRELALQQIPRYLEQLQDLGASLKDIAILVRRNEEGQQIVAHLLQYRNSPEARTDLRYDVVSNESLRLDGAATVNLLLAALQYLLNPDDDIARAQLAYEFSRLHEPERGLTDVFAVTNQTIFESYLPAAFTREKTALKKLPLYELTENLIQIFRLGDKPGELAYLQAFQDLVLEFSSRERNDLGMFMEWWEENKHKKSIQVSGEVEAVQLLTIHKSKGLQFKYVILPFCSWSLDHDAMKAPNLWVKSDVPPFDRAGYLPVKYSGALKQTYFADAYREEQTRVYLDNLNLLYVALTRAEHGLLVMVPHPNNRSAGKTVAPLLYQSIQQAPELMKSWKLGEERLALGTWQHTPARKPREQANPLSLQKYPAGPWRDKLIIRQQAKDYFQQPAREMEKQERINYGIYMHAVLSRIHYANELTGTIARLVHEGYIAAEEQMTLQDQLQQLLATAPVGSWFEAGWEVRTEVPILVPDQPESRIDRLITRDRHAVVIDFKTGEPNKRDQKQVQDYMDILRQMNYTEVEGYLLYLRTGEVVSMHQPRIKTTRRSDEHQLGLF